MRSIAYIAGSILAGAFVFRITEPVLTSPCSRDIEAGLPNDIERAVMRIKALVSAKSPAYMRNLQDIENIILALREKIKKLGSFMGESGSEQQTRDEMENIDEIYRLVIECKISMFPVASLIQYCNLDDINECKNTITAYLDACNISSTKALCAFSQRK